MTSRPPSLLTGPGGARGQGLVAVFLLGIALFMPPVLMLFMRAEMIFGFPLSVLYVFVAWSGFVALLALASRRLGRR